MVKQNIVQALGGEFGAAEVGMDVQNRQGGEGVLHLVDGGGVHGCEMGLWDIGIYVTAVRRAEIGLAEFFLRSMDSTAGSAGISDCFALTAAAAEAKRTRSSRESPRAR